MALTKVPSNLDSVTATTQSQGDGSTNVATTAYVDTGLANLIDSAPGNLNTLNELAAAMNDNASFFSTVLPLSGGTMTGALTTNGVINTGTSHNFAINTPNSLRINIDSNNSATDQVFVIGHNQTAVDTSNSVLMTILESGNVGIGGTPQTTVGKLDIIGASNEYDTAPMVTFKTTGTNAANRNWSIGALDINYGDFHIGCGDSNSDFFDANAHSKLTINKDGKVGIGTVSPATILHTRTSESTSNHNSGGGFHLVSNSTAGSRAVNLFLDADGGNFSTTSDGAYAYLEKVGGGGDFKLINQDTSNMIFQTSGTERLRIDGSGNIGFNTAGIAVGATSDAQVSTATPNRIVLNNDYSNGYTDASLKMYLFNSGNTRQGFTSGPAYDLQYHSSGDSSGRHVFYVANTEVGRFAANGLHVGVASSNSYVYLGSQGGAFGGNSSNWMRASGSTLMFNSALSTSSGSNAYVWEASGSTRMALEGNGKLKLPQSPAAGGGETATLKFNTSNGAVAYDSSTREHKDDIEPITIDTAKVYDLEAKSFTWNNKTLSPGEKGFGYIAEEVETVLPELVNTKDGVAHGVNYQMIAVLLLEEVKKLKSRIETLEG